MVVGWFVRCVAIAAGRIDSINSHSESLTYLSLSATVLSSPPHTVLLEFRFLTFQSTSQTSTIYQSLCTRILTVCVVTQWFLHRPLVLFLPYSLFLSRLSLLGSRFATALHQVQYSSNHVLVFYRIGAEFVWAICDSFFTRSAIRTGGLS